jgi:hypothetical protein
MKRVAAIVAALVFVTLSSASVLRAAVLLVGDGTPSSCTQIAVETALAAAGHNGHDTIRFRCGAAPVTITFVAVAPGSVAALNIPSQTTIDGEGLVSLSGRGAGGSLVMVPADASAVFENLAIRNAGPGPAIIVEGTLTVRHSTVSDSFAEAFLNRGTLIVRDSTISGAGQTSTGAIQNRGALTVHGSSFFNNDQGAIVNFGTADVVGCVFSGNVSVAGTIVNAEGSLTVKDSMFSHNGSESVGGAIDNAEGATLAVNDSTFFGNTAMLEGGAIANGGALTLTNSQLIDNTAGPASFFDSFGGGVSSFGDAIIDRTFLVGNIASVGGGIAQRGGTLTIKNSFIFENTATAGTGGGGIFVQAGSPQPVLKHTTVTNNTPNDISVQP